MADGAVYGKTTEADDSKPKGCCLWWKHLRGLRFVVKLLEAVLSAIAFFCEEFVEHCTNCNGLYFFEFMSCTAMLLSVVVVVVYCTTLSDKITLTRLMFLDIWFTLIVGLLFLVASVVFAATKDGSHLENSSVAFGFLASFMFMIDFGLLLKKEKVQLCKKDVGGAAPPNQQVRAPEVQPLNEPQSQV